jgi:hypothetical protein
VFSCVRANTEARLGFLAGGRLPPTPLTLTLTLP